MITIKEYANSWGISETAVRKQLKTYEKELEGHIVKQGRAFYLDNSAKAFLDRHRLERVVMEQTEKDNNEQQLTLLKNEVDRLQKLLIAEKEEKAQLMEYRAKASLYLEDKNQKEAELRETRESLREIELKAKELEVRTQEQEKRAKELETRLDTTEKELGSFTPSLFGFYRKK